jgi:serine/threonine protein kinase
LVFEEYRIRRIYDGQISIHDYQKRFPGHFEELQRLAGGSIGTSWSAPGTLRIPSDPEMVMVGVGYRLVLPIGRGNYGEVWKAEAPGGVEVAIKLSRALGHRVTEDELRSLEAIKHLRHPFLIQLQAFFRRDDQIIAVMELADGSLEDRLHHFQTQGLNGIPVEELLNYMREAAEALDYLHQEGRLHRDIKPANILLANGHVKVGDFGLARLFDKEALNVTSTLRGTPQFIAPEVLSNRVGPTSDQYSLAATYVELRLGRPAFNGTTQFEVMQQHLRGVPDLTGLPDEEGRVLLKALAKKPEERFATCSEFAQALASAVQCSATPTEPSKHARSIVSRMAGGAVAAALLAAAIWYFFHRPSLGQTARVPVPTPSLEMRDSLKVKAGQSVTFDIHLRNLGGGTIIKFDRQQLPPQVSVEQNSFDDSKAFCDASIRTDPDAEDGSYNLVVVAHKHGKDLVSRSIRVSVEALPLFVPKGFARDESAENRAKAMDGRRYWSRIRPDPDPAPGDSIFVLVPGSREKNLNTFYIMQRKVSNRLFARFVEARPELKIGDDWRKIEVSKSKSYVAHAYPDLPVFNVGVDYAEKMATWLGGRLPSCMEWDKAAGRFEKDGREGPFQGEWKAGQTSRVAVGRRDIGPASIREFEDDRSPFDCFDMSGNGDEWTRDTHSGRRIPITHPSFSDAIHLRGRSYRADSPLLFKDLEKPAPPSPYSDFRSDLSFRVVIELPKPD